MRAPSPAGGLTAPADGALRERRINTSHTCLCILLQTKFLFLPSVFPVKRNHVGPSVPWEHFTSSHSADVCPRKEWKFPALATRSPSVRHLSVRARLFVWRSGLRGRRTSSHFILVPFPASLPVNSLSGMLMGSVILFLFARLCCFDFV